MFWSQESLVLLLLCLLERSDSCLSGEGFVFFFFFLLPVQAWQKDQKISHLVSTSAWHSVSSHFSQGSLCRPVERVMRKESVVESVEDRIARKEWRACAPGPQSASTFTTFSFTSSSVAVRKSFGREKYRRSRSWLSHVSPTSFHSHKPTDLWSAGLGSGSLDLWPSQSCHPISAWPWHIP